MLARNNRALSNKTFTESIDAFVKALGVTAGFDGVTNDLDISEENFKAGFTALKTALVNKLATKADATTDDE